MKKHLSLLLALALLLSLAACSGGTNPTATVTPTEAPSAEPTEAPASGPVAEEVKGVTVPEFAVTVNGVSVTQVEMAAYPIYSVQATSVNSSGTESTKTYIGFAISDVLAAAGLAEQYVWLEVTATDGYAVTFEGDVIYADTTLLAVTRDGSAFSNGPWFAPCADGTTGNYLQDMASILVNTTAGAPEIEIDTPDVPDNAGEPDEMKLPEILDRTDKVEFAPYSFLVNGVEVTNDTLAGLSIYKISATTVNNAGESSTADYTGYKLADVLEACGVTGAVTVKAIANDGYESEIAAELIDSEYTLVAIEKDKELGEEGTIWLAPCSETSSKSFCKLVVEITAE